MNRRLGNTKLRRNFIKRRNKRLWRKVLRTKFNNLLKETYIPFFSGSLDRRSPLMEILDEYK